MPPKQFQPLPCEYFVKPVIPYFACPPVGRLDGTGGSTRSAASERDRIAIVSHASMVMMQVEELVDLPSALDAFRKPPLSHVPVFVHLDLVRGLARDEAGLRFLASLDRVDGIVTVHHHLVSAARRFGLQAIVRLFIQDGRSVKRGLVVIDKSRPNAIELLPGIAGVEVAEDFKRLPIPRFAGGLIRNTTVLEKILAAGYQAVSTSNESLWIKNAEF